MNKFKKLITRYSDELKHSENVPLTFQKAWQWFWKHRNKVSSSLEEDVAAVERFLISMALVTMRVKNLKFGKFQQWKWNKEATALFCRQKESFNKGFSNGRPRDAQAAQILRYSMLETAIGFIAVNPAQALYFFDLFNREVISGALYTFSTPDFERLLDSLPLLNVDDELLPAYHPEEKETFKEEEITDNTYWGWGMFESPRVRTFKEALKSLEWASTWLQCTDVLCHWFHSHPDLNEEEFIHYATQLAEKTNAKGILTRSQASNCNAILTELKKDFGRNPIEPLFVASQPEPEETPLQPGEEVSRIGSPAAPADTFF